MGEIVNERRSPAGRGRIDEPIRAAGLDLLSLVVEWTKSPDDWQLIDAELETLFDALGKDDPATFQTSMEALRQLAPKRILRMRAIADESRVPAAERIRERIGTLVHQLDNTPVKDRGPAPEVRYWPSNTKPAP